MATNYALDDLLSFLIHASERGLIPAATAQALAVASRNIFAVLTDHEKTDIRTLNLDKIIKRFTNKRAKEFSPSSLAEYGRRVRKAVELFVAWRNDPTGFTVTTRSTGRVAALSGVSGASARALGATLSVDPAQTPCGEGNYETTIPVRPGQLVTISNLPRDLSKAEAERLVEFVRMLAVA